MANDIDIHECDYFFRELPGWKLLQAVRVIKDGGADNMGFLKKVARDATKRQFENWGKPRLFGNDGAAVRPSVNSPSMQMGGIDPDVLASVRAKSQPLPRF